jgi:hypothetical protein
MIKRVAELIQRTAAQAILPRFLALCSDDIEEKSPGELVTSADREAQALLTQGLMATVFTLVNPVRTWPHGICPTGCGTNSNWGLKNTSI